MVGLFSGIVVTAILISIFEKQRIAYRKTALYLLAVAVLSVSLLGIFKDTSFIKNTSLLNRFASLIKLDVVSVISGEGHARTLLWSMAYKGVQEKPLLGWGQDNFGYVFSKYYDPKMYAQEQWFDRTHNVFFDWLIASGILGLLSYLSLFVALLYMVWKKTEGDGEWDVAQKAILTGLFTAYFVHNLFVFDNLASYILCFVMFSYVASRYKNVEGAELNKYSPLVKNEVAQVVIACIVLIGLVYTINTVVYKPYMAGRLLIQSLEEQTYDKAVLGSGIRNKTSEERINPLKESISLNTLGDTEIREKITDVAISIIGREKDQSILKDLAKFVDEQYEEQFRKTPNDSRPYIFYSKYLERIGQYDLAEKSIDKAIELSPTKQSFLYQKASVLLGQKKMLEASLVLKKAYDLAPENNEARVLYAVGLIYNKQFDSASKIIGTSTEVISDKRLMQAYIQSGNFTELARVVKIKVDANPDDAQGHVSLAAIYLKLNRRSDAIAEIQKAMVLEPKFNSQGEFYIKEIQAGRDPSGD
jgi:tetratricopeptide (TPR) repeat protein